MDNLRNDPPDEGSKSPPPFGTHFDPHSNPVDPNNPYQTQPPPVPEPPTTHDGNPDELKHDHYSEAAQHKLRDEHGRFIHEQNHTPSDPQPIPSQATPNPPVPPNPSTFIPPIVEINQNTEPSSKKDPPLFGFFLTNPVTYFKIFLNKLIKRQAITLKIPVLAILIIMVGIGGFGIGFQSGLNWALFRLFPNYSPILHRAITEQGIIQKSSKGEYYLKSDDKNKSMWTLRSVSANVKLEDFVGKQVQIKGNLTPTPNLIDVSEVIEFTQ